MSEIITMPKFYSNREVAEILGIQPATVRQIKSRKADELQGLWTNDNEDGETIWSQEGLDKIAELVNTDKTKEYRAGALARRTQKAIAVDRSELNYSHDSQSSTRTGHEVSSYELPDTTASGGRYADLPEQVGDAIGTTLADSDGIHRMDVQVVKSFLRRANLSDVNIDIAALLGRKS